MPALAIVPAEVLAPTDGSGTFVSGIAQVAFTAGQAGMLDPAANRYILATSDGPPPPASATYGIAIHGTLAGQRLTLMTGKTGDIALGTAAPLVGTVYAVGLAGAIIPAAEVLSGDAVMLLGIGKTGNKLALNTFNPSIAKA